MKNHATEEIFLPISDGLNVSEKALGISNVVQPPPSLLDTPVRLRSSVLFWEMLWETLWSHSDGIVIVISPWCQNAEVTTQRADCKTASCSSIPVHQWRRLSSVSEDIFRSGGLPCGSLPATLPLLPKLWTHPGRQCQWDYTPCIYTTHCLHTDFAAGRLSIYATAYLAYVHLSLHACEVVFVQLW